MFPAGRLLSEARRRPEAGRARDGGPFSIDPPHTPRLAGVSSDLAVADDPVPAVEPKNAVIGVDDGAAGVHLGPTVLAVRAPCASIDPDHDVRNVGMHSLAD